MEKLKAMDPEREKELDKEPEQEFEEYVAYEREHRNEDEQTYGEFGDEDLDTDILEEDRDEFLDE